MSEALADLAEIRLNSGSKRTIGLSDEVIMKFLETDETLFRAIEEAVITHRRYREEFGDEFLMGNEETLVTELQSDYVNFYAPATVNPYVAIAARGPWVITSHGSVLHDNGSYGMLGGGHGPSEVIETMSKIINHVENNAYPYYQEKQLDETSATYMADAVCSSAVVWGWNTGLPSCSYQAMVSSICDPVSTSMSPSPSTSAA